jgi:phage terminase small subunit
MPRRKSTAPRHLAVATRRWFDQVLVDYDLEPHHVRLLTLAAEAWDAGQRAREQLAAEGSTYVDRYGAPHPHPAAAIERDSRVSFARMIRELDLDAAPPADPRPPRRGRVS